MSQKLQKRMYRATLIENALEGKGRRRRRGTGRAEKMGRGRQGSVRILLTVIKREVKGVGKRKILKLRKTDPFSEMETGYLKLLAIKE